MHRDIVNCDIKRVSVRMNDATMYDGDERRDYGPLQRRQDESYLHPRQGRL